MSLTIEEFGVGTLIAIEEFGAQTIRKGIAMTQGGVLLVEFRGNGGKTRAKVLRPDKCLSAARQAYSGVQGVRIILVHCGFSWRVSL